MEKEFLKYQGIEVILQKDPNKFRGLTVIMKEARRILKDLLGTESESPGKKAMKQSILNYINEEIEIRRAAS